MAKYIILLLVLLSLLFFVFDKKEKLPNYYEIIKDKTGIPIAKVLVLQDKNSFALTIQDDFVIKDRSGNIIRKVKGGLKNGSLVYDKDKGFVVQASTTTDALGVHEIILNVENGNAIQMGNGFYLGELHFHLDKNKKISVVNELDLETYLIGVLAGEVFPTFHPNAIKAQAITSRSFALTEIQHNFKNKWHLKSTTDSQVFVGLSKIPEKFKEAIIETKGIVILEDNLPVRAYYAAACGGATADLTTFDWEKNQASVLQARPCSFCKDMKPPKFFWDYVYKKADVLSAIESYYSLPSGSFDNLLVSKEDSFGRVLELTAESNEKSIVINANRFRVSILKAPADLRSCLFKMDLQGDHIFFKGVGWEHGVGLCQYGSQGQALVGKSYPEILQFYYPGSRIGKFY